MSQTLGHWHCQEQVIVTQALAQYGVYMILGTIPSTIPTKESKHEPFFYFFHYNSQKIL